MIYSLCIIIIVFKIITCPKKETKERKKVVSIVVLLLERSRFKSQLKSLCKGFLWIHGPKTCLLG